MKKLILLVLFVAAFSAQAQAARLRIPFCSDCPYIAPVADLPDSAEFFSEEHQGFADVGYMYKQFWILGVPLWNYDEQYILHIKDQDVYFEVGEEDLKQMQEKYQLGSLGNPISFWDKMGGKAIVLLLVGFIVWGYLPGKKKEETKKEEFFGK